MRRFALAIIVGLLTCSVSGLSSVVMTEPCTGYEQPGQDDGGCPPTCVTCGCCAQAVEPVTLVAATALEILVAAVDDFTSRPPRTSSLDILHVPKSRLA